MCSLFYVLDELISKKAAAWFLIPAYFSTCIPDPWINQYQRMTGNMTFRNTLVHHMCFATCRSAIWASSPYAVLPYHDQMAKQLVWRAFSYGKPAYGDMSLCKLGYGKTTPHCHLWSGHIHYKNLQTQTPVSPKLQNLSRSLDKKLCVTKNVKWVPHYLIFAPHVHGWAVMGSCKTKMAHLIQNCGSVQSG